MRKDRFGAGRLTRLLAIGAALMLGMTACTDLPDEATEQSAEPASSEIVLRGWVDPAEDRDFTIAYFTPAEINTYTEALSRGVEYAAEALGVTVDVIHNDWNAIEQLDQVTSAIDSGKYDGFLIDPVDPNVLCKIASQDAPNAGIPVVIVTAAICGDPDHTEGTAGFSASQSKYAHDFYADWVLGEISEQGGGEVALLVGPAQDALSTSLVASFEERSSEHPEVEISQTLYGDYTAATAVGLVDTLLSTAPQTSVIVSSYDQMSLGAVKALEAAGHAAGDIAIYNLGGDETTFPLMGSGWIRGTLLLEPAAEAAQGLEMLIAELEGAEHPVFNNLVKDPSSSRGVLITAENLHDFWASDES